MSLDGNQAGNWKPPRYKNISKGKVLKKEEEKSDQQRQSSSVLLVSKSTGIRLIATA
jgi:hypothetical protein